jgi:hypothetical protein
LQLLVTYSQDKPHNPYSPTPVPVDETRLGSVSLRRRRCVKIGHRFRGGTV